MFKSHRERNANHLNALAIAHAMLKPHSYVEIGCRNGHSLSLARCPSVAIDPAFSHTCPLLAPTRFFRETSDDFSAPPNVAEILKQPLDLAFIDGMHLVEFALRDFMNLEQHAAQHAVIWGARGSTVYISA